MEKLFHYVELSYGKAIPLDGTVLWKSYPIRWNSLMVMLSHYRTGQALWAPEA